MIVEKTAKRAQAQLIVDCAVCPSWKQREDQKELMAVYGIFVTFEGGGTQTFPDVGTNKDSAEKLAALLLGKALLPDALYDVVFDFVYQEGAVKD